MPGYVPGPPPRKPGPKKRWYGVGGALLTLGVILGLAGGFGMIGGVMDKLPSVEHTFGNDEMTVVHFDAGESRVIFVSSAGKDHQVHCDVATRTGSDDEAEIKNYDGGLTLGEWQAVFTVTAQQSADFAVTCQGHASDKFGVGGNAKPTAVIGGVFAVLSGGFLCTVGIVALIVIAVLRHRRRG
ncbi:MULTISPECIES: hypothetical protein [unclassified Mycolicibacterium]|uniref:hypothetical protein n=1 Tax=unclassified Mycolicibacterium TaxID=2636767 RepID=UPI0012DE82CF|nr:MULTISPECIES: hypothetical protein [unclassified Mycolicibacterium]MUL81113.1 hypothetical protein [Mycolicibacterium sp. CBMA 329]MUL86879.1 hypothetical protein [Mycolicibacterium sp. CBMA 331]MUL98837.1 hypothetical protein [Mycolicibacterium sp. CBMA 334]MUM37176.1 hypothetical protein [Mycolicibacterium sp. CBMA 247]MUM42944.1 hypothetical protein [Mycolicibacterium sp. CBMA 294]